MVVVAKGQHLGLALDLLVEAGQGLGGIPPVPVGAKVGHDLAQAVLPVDKGLRQGVRCSTRRLWWNWLRRDSRVVAVAMPKEPPRLRIRLKMPVALPIFSWEMRDMVRVVRATKVEPRPKPWTNRGHQAVAKSIWVL